jgi:1,4-alpha-glucan branching enzyme
MGFQVQVKQKLDSYFSQKSFMYQLRPFLIFFLFWSCFQLGAQVVWTEPYFPKATDPVTIYYDASQGTAGLKDCGCTVYIHTGVVTSQSLSSSDWKNVITTWGVANANWAMKPVAGRPNVYSFSIMPGIRAYYGVASGIDIQQLAMVFRNANGSKEGKDVGSKDLFAKVYNQTGLLTALLSPSTQSLVVDPGAVIPVRAVASESANLTLQDNGQTLYNTKGTLLEYSLTAAAFGTHKINCVVATPAKTDTLSFVYSVRNSKPPLDPPFGTQAGVTFLPDNKVRLALYAPGKAGIFLVGDFNNWTASDAFQMNRSVDGTLHWIEVNTLASVQTYLYQYQLESGLRIGDPYSTLVLDPNNDRFIPSVTFPNLPAYPTGKTTGIVTVLQTGKPAFPWKNNNFAKPSKGKLQVYELLVRDFIARHDYLTLIDTLDYLQRLGINAIELMPIQEFEGNNSWGYNPSYHMALDKYYGTPEHLKALVDACHSRGIAIILDVVFNHAFGQSPLAQMYWDNANQRPSADNPWLNPTPTHDFNVGYDFNHESPATKTFVKTVLNYWQKEFKVDGFRFDLSKGFTQKITLGDVAAWGRYDASRIAILRGYADAIWSVDPQAYVILEHFADNVEELELARQGMMLWSNQNFQFNEGTLGVNHDWGGLNYQNRGMEFPNAVLYMESHDEERIMYKNLQFGSRNGAYNVKELNTALQRTEMANFIFYSVPGPKMHWQFGELGYDYSINTCENLVVSKDCRLSIKPIRWDYQQLAARKKVYDLIRVMAFLRRTYPVFHTNNFSTTLSGSDYKRVVLTDDKMTVMALANSTLTAQTTTVTFPVPGWWYDYFQRDSFFLSANNRTIALQPGEYKLFSTSKLRNVPAGVITSNKDFIEQMYAVKLSPNPTAGPVQIRYFLQDPAYVKISITNALGQVVHSLVREREPAGEQLHEWNPSTGAGMYWVNIQFENGVISKPLVVH